MIMMNDLYGRYEPYELRGLMGRHQFAGLMASNRSKPGVYWALLFPCQDQVLNPP